MNINMDAANGLTQLMQLIKDGKLSNDYSEWRAFISELKDALPVVEAATFQYQDLLILLNLLPS